VPESFKVLVKELQALCLDMRVLDSEGNEIELKDDDEDDYQPNHFRDDDDFYGDTYSSDAEFSEAGYTLKAESDDDDLAAEDEELLGSDEDSFLSDEDEE
jgi:DNA-directed RNA polymerase subunit beta